MPASIRKLCARAALITLIITGGLIMGALTPAYSQADGQSGDKAAPPQD